MIEAPSLLPTQKVGFGVVLSTNTRRMFVEPRQQILGELPRLRIQSQNTIR